MARPLSKKFLQLVVASAFVGAGYGVKLQYMQKASAKAMERTCQEVWDEAMEKAAAGEDGGPDSTAKTKSNFFKLGLLTKREEDWPHTDRGRLRSSELRQDRFCGAYLRKFEPTREVKQKSVQDAKSALIASRSEKAPDEMTELGAAFRQVLRRECCIHEPDEDDRPSLWQSVAPPATDSSVQPATGPGRTPVLTGSPAPVTTTGSSGSAPVRPPDSPATASTRPGGSFVRRRSPTHTPVLTGSPAPVTTGSSGSAPVDSPGSPATDSSGQPPARPGSPAAVSPVPSAPQQGTSNAADASAAPVQGAGAQPNKGSKGCC
ncbi:unnamed protein product [Amoebophrya sp. A25]|nr:unnamed protein product [Amoebophrya sp. A25]|eukprot:GSA25T00016863001.1